MANFFNNNNGNGNFNGGNNGFGNFNPNQNSAFINGGITRQLPTQPGRNFVQQPNTNMGMMNNQQMINPNQQPYVVNHQNIQQPQLGQVYNPNQQFNPNDVNFRHNEKDEEFFQRIVEVILINGLASTKEGISRQKGYTCTFRGNTFGITMNLIFDQVYKHLQPFVINTNKVAEVGIGTGQEIDEQFLSKATFLGPQISALRDNYGRERTMNQRMVAYYVDQLSQYIDAIGEYINRYIKKDANGNYVDTPELQQVMSRRFRYSCINITPIINVQPQQVQDNYGRVMVVNVPNITFVYSLTEASTLRIKQDVAFMETK